MLKTVLSTSLLLSSLSTFANTITVKDPTYQWSANFNATSDASVYMSSNIANGLSTYNKSSSAYPVGCGVVSHSTVKLAELLFTMKTKLKLTWASNGKNFEKNVTFDVGMGINGHNTQNWWLMPHSYDNEQKKTINLGSGYVAKIIGTTNNNFVFTIGT